LRNERTGAFAFIDKVNNDLSIRNRQIIVGQIKLELA